MGRLFDDFDLRGGGVVSLVGAGGKTTLMFQLARELAAAGRSVLTTTTTKIFVPRPDQSPTLVIAKDLPTLLGKLKSPPFGGSHVTAAASELPGQNKLAGYPPELIGALNETGCFEWILVEADGSRRLPLKAPGEHEPVIPQSSTRVIAVVGLEAVGNPLDDEHVFRSRDYSRITGIPAGSPVTAESVVSALLSPEGIFKNSPPRSRRIVFLNKADDDPDRLSAGDTIARSLLALGSVKIHLVLTGSLLPEPRILKRTPTAGIILAAGKSSRLGRPKQLLDAGGGQTLLAKTVQTALASRLERVVLVLGSDAETLRASLGQLAFDSRLSVAVNPGFEEGMSSSLRAGLHEVSNFPAIMVILADHPYLDHRLIDLLLTSFWNSDKDICLPCCNGRQGSPTIFGKRFYPDILKIRGDMGGRQIIRENPENLLRVEIESEDSFFDIDTEEDLARWIEKPRGSS